MENINLKDYFGKDKERTSIFIPSEETREGKFNDTQALSTLSPSKVPLFTIGPLGAWSNRWDIVDFSVEFLGNVKESQDAPKAKSKPVQEIKEERIEVTPEKPKKAVSGRTLDDILGTANKEYINPAALKVMNRS